MTKEERNDILEQLRYSADWTIKAQGLMKHLSNPEFDDLVEKIAQQLFVKLEVLVDDELGKQIEKAMKSTEHLADFEELAGVGR